LKKIIYNGKFIDAGTAIVAAQSRGLRYGDGCFETMKMVNAKIALKDFHFERLFSSLYALGFEMPKSFTAAEMEQQVISLAQKNQCTDHSRIWLAVFRSNGGLYDPENNFPNYIIEVEHLESSIGTFNENGLVVDVFKDARKAADNFSHIKSNNFLPYILAAAWAKKNQLNDAILLNSFDKIADTTIANIFIVTDGIIKTPALSEGCISGVMRKYLIQCCRKEGLPIEECQLTGDDLKNANEVFLTNVIRGIRWVREVGEAGYQFSISKMLYDKFVKPLWK
jgi:branched-chain amino acid aminotransferase